MTNKKKCIIVDIDGTIADCNHRLHFLDQGHKKKLWDEFFAAAEHDVPIRDMLDMLDIFRMSSAHPAIVLVTGRPDSIRDLTVKWCGRHGVYFHELHMRIEGDRRHDHIVKQDIVTEICKKYDVWFALEDRTRNVEMFRRNGIRCLQVANGDF